MKENVVNYENSCDPSRITTQAAPSGDHAQQEKEYYERNYAKAAREATIREALNLKIERAQQNYSKLIQLRDSLPATYLDQRVSSFPSFNDIV